MYAYSQYLNMKEKIVNIYTHMTVDIMWNWIQRKYPSKWNEQIKTARDWLFVIGWFPATAYKSKITLRYRCLDNLQSRTCVRVYGTWNGLCLKIILWIYILFLLKGLCFILCDYIILDCVTDNMLSSELNRLQHIGYMSMVCDMKRKWKIEKKWNCNWTCMWLIYRCWVVSCVRYTRLDVPVCQLPGRSVCTYGIISSMKACWI